MGVPVIDFADGGRGCFPNQITYSDWTSPGTLRAFFAFDQAPGNIYECETSLDLIHWTPTRRVSSYIGPSCVTFDVDPAEGFCRIKIISQARFLEILNGGKAPSGILNSGKNEIQRLS